MTTTPSPDTPQPKNRSRRWRPSFLSIVIAIVGLLGILLLTYPTAAAWVSQYNQSHIVNTYDEDVASSDPSAEIQWDQAQRYNEQLESGAFLKSNSNKPTAGTEADTDLAYENLLAVDDSGLMGRLRIPSISADLPIYHGTDDDTLTQGIGHLEGTSLPVGGVGTRSVLTGHRGLSTSRLFTDLNKVVEGDTFTLEILDEVLTYKVIEVKVVDPDQTQELLPDPERDLLTLVTCTPLGINSQRILVTGERITPTPIRDVEAAGQDSDVPGFPWWIVWTTAAALVAVGYVWRAGKQRQ